MKLEMTKNELAKAIRKNLKTVFGNTMKFSVRSKYIGGTPSITIQIKEAHEGYFKTFEEYKRENQHLIVFYGQDTYEQMMEQYPKNRLSTLTEEVKDVITKLGNEFNYNNSDPYTDYFDVGYYLTITDGGEDIIKLH